MANISTIRRQRQPLSRPWAALLELFYSRAGLSLPRLKKLDGDEVPEPYRRLLVHSDDLTPTLEGYYHDTLRVTALSRRHEDTSYMREVVLHLSGSGKPVVYGVIRIALNHLPPVSAKRVLEDQVPFGSILHADGVAHLSWPQAFFRAEPDPHMQTALGMRRSSPLYGRRNVLVDGSRRLLAEVIEVLASVSDPESPVEPERNGRARKANGEC